MYQLSEQILEKLLEKTLNPWILYYLQALTELGDHSKAPRDLQTSDYVFLYKLHTQDAHKGFPAVLLDTS